MKPSFLSLVISTAILQPLLLAGTSVHALDVENAKQQERASSHDLQPLILLNKQNKFNQAYDLAIRMRGDWEGDEDFDFNFGLAAAQTRHFNEAIFAFERLIYIQPNNIRVHLELARCHYFLNNLTAAKAGFQQVASQNPSKELQSQINHFLNRIAEQQQQVEQSWVNTLGIAAGHDSNINAAADLESIDATFFYENTPALKGVLTLNDDQKTKDSPYYQVRGKSFYLQPLSKRSSLDLSLSGAHKDNTLDDDYDLSSLSLQGGLRYVRGEYNYRIGAVARQYWLASDNLQNQLLANISWQWVFARNWKTTTELEIGRQNNHINNALNFLQWQGKLALKHRTNSFSQNLQLGFGQDKANESKFEYQGRNYITLGYQATTPFTSKQQGYGLLNYRLNDHVGAYADDHVFFAGETREDKMAQVVLGWAYSFMPNTALRIQASHHINSSNLELYDYQRTLIETGLSISFK